MIPFIDIFGLNISYDELLVKAGGKKNINTLFKTLTVIEKNTQNKPKGSPIVVRKAYKENGNVILFPRIVSKMLKKYNIINDIRYKTYEDVLSFDKLEINMPLYDYQKEIVDYLLVQQFNQTNVEQCVAIAYLQMDTGLGKTRIGCAIINELQLHTIIVVPTIAIGHQWIDECKELYPEINILFYNNIQHKKQLYDITSYHIIIIVVNTFCNKSIDFIQSFGCIIIDEAHEYHTKKFSNVLWLAQTKIVLGLSATPNDRLDGLDEYVQLHLGKPIIARNITSINIIQFKCQVKTIHYYGNPEYTSSVLTPKGLISSILTIGNIIRDMERIALIIDEIKELYDGKHGIFVFAEHRHFLNILKEELLHMNYNVLDDNDISIFKGGINTDDINKAKVESKQNKGYVILTTYGFSRRGISITDMTSLILATPRKSGIKQIVGRILRKGSDESIVRNIIDIVDMRSIFRNQYKYREQVYKDRKYPILERKVYSKSSKHNTITDDNDNDNDNGDVIIDDDDNDNDNDNDNDIDKMFDHIYS